MEGPEDQTVLDGEIAVFRCRAEGNPKPQVTWRRGGHRLTSGHPGRYVITALPDGGSILRVDPVRQNKDESDYECVAENGVADPVVAEATLTVFTGQSQSIPC